MTARAGTALRHGFAQNPTGVCVVTVADGTDVQGVTIGSLVSISLEPPLLGFFVGQERSILGSLLPGTAVTANVLGAGQVALARRMATRGHSAVPAQHLCREGGWALVRRAVASYSGPVERVLPLGDHCLVVVAVEAVRATPGRAPLVFHDSRFTTTQE
ncbi:MAG: flavin reductase family protein [Nocardioidaceae bacterium]|nr:flavin reductase family protein [Nocardioidaceae bacterium]